MGKCDERKKFRKTTEIRFFLLHNSSLCDGRRPAAAVAPSFWILQPRRFFFFFFEKALWAGETRKIFSPHFLAEKTGQVLLMCGGAHFPAASPKLLLLFFSVELFFFLAFFFFLSFSFCLAINRIFCLFLLLSPSPSPLHFFCLAKIFPFHYPSATELILSSFRTKTSTLTIFL